MSSESISTSSSINIWVRTSSFVLYMTHSSTDFTISIDGAVTSYIISIWRCIN